MFSVADCTGHGVPGGFMSMIGNTLLNEIVKEKKIYSPAEILAKLNRGVVDLLSHGNTDGNKQNDGMDIAIGQYDIESNTIKIALANTISFLVQDNNIKELKGDLYSIGETPRTGQAPQYKEHTINADKGTTLYLFSDGFADQFGGKEQKKFMKANFKDLLFKIHSKSPKDQEIVLEKTFDEWRNDTNQIDDVLVMGIRF